MSLCTTACERFFSIPELRLSLSDHVEANADISKLARVDRLSYSLLVPLLLTNIDVRLKDVVSVASLLKAGLLAVGLEGRGGLVSGGLAAVAVLVVLIRE